MEENFINQSIVVEELFELPAEQPIKVFIKLNNNNEIIEVDSSEFIKDLTGWIEIDSGFGDKYRLAKNYYFDKPVTDEDWTYNYIYENGKVIKK